MKRAVYSIPFKDILSEIENLQVFALCKEFDELSLEDNTGGSSSSSSTSQVQPSSYGYRGTFHSFLRSWTHSLWNQPIIEQLRAPFMDLPRHFIESSFQSYNILMGLGFRFLPGQSEFLHHELMLPESFDRLSFLSNSLGLSSHIGALPAALLFTFSSSGGGLRGLVTSNEVTKILVEVITHYDGRYGRFLVNVCLGVGCTVWYGFVPGTVPSHAMENSLFSPFDSYDPFFFMDHYEPGFRRVSFVERNDVSASVESAFGNEHPFAEIQIPASGNVLKAAGLGVMVSFFLAVGIVPNISGGINIGL